MNKSEFIRAVAEKAGESFSKVVAVIDAMDEVILAQLTNCEEVKCGSFVAKAKKMAATTGRNPKSGETISIPARIKISFTPSAKLKKEVNGE